MPTLANDNVNQLCCTSRSAPSAGGAAFEDFTINNVSANYVITCSQLVAGAGAGKQVISCDYQAANTVRVTWDADPGAGAVLAFTVWIK